MVEFIKIFLYHIIISKSLWFPLDPSAIPMAYPSAEISIERIIPSFYCNPNSKLHIISKSPRVSKIFKREFSEAANIYLPEGEIAIE